MFVVCGEALIDLFMTGTPGQVDMFKAQHGGSPYNVAVGMARLGSEVGFFSGISTDFLGQQIMRALEAEKISQNYVVPKNAPTTLSLVMLDAQGGPSYAFYGANAADRVLELVDLPVLTSATTGLHFGSYSLVCEPAANTYMALAEREAGQRLISVDPNVRLNVETDVALWRTRVAQWVALASVVKVSIEDLELLYPGADPVLLAESWVAGGVGLVVVTKGAAGALAVTANFMQEVAAPLVMVVDGVGAGDAFQAALLHQLSFRGCRDVAALKALSDSDLLEIINFACMAGALTCTRQGANLPRLVEIQKALSS